MTEAGASRFGDFTLDRAERRLARDGAPVELSARYFDALALLVDEAGSLVTKDRFMDEVWRGIPVTDEALTQCVRSLRRALGDDAAHPRFIETVPKHGYRFIAPVEERGVRSAVEMTRESPAAGLSPWQRTALFALAGVVGGGAAGVIGGLFYTFAGSAQPLAPGMGAVSVLLVLLCLNIAVGVIAGAAIGSGIAIARHLAPQSRWIGALGGAAGGIVVGALAKLLGLDAFQLLLGRTPGEITGAMEGGLLGFATGLACAWVGGGARLNRRVLLAALPGALAGLAIALLGGRMMGGSLDVIARGFPDSRLSLARLGALFGERGFGPTTQLVTCAIEGAVFALCVVGAMVLMRRTLRTGPA